MPRLVRALSFVLLVATTPVLVATPGAMTFGAPFPLTNAHYGSIPALNWVVGSDGRDAYVFWSSVYADARMTRVDGGNREGVRIPSGELYDAVWTGAHFLIATTGINGLLQTHTLNLRGELGEPYTLAGKAKYPKLAFNGKIALLLYQADGAAWALPLDANGRPAGAAALRVADDLFYGAISVASDGSGFAALTSSLSATRRELLLTVFNASAEITSTEQLRPEHWHDTAIASNGHNYLAVWSAGSRVEAAIVWPDGSSNTSVLQHWRSAAGLGRPAAAWNGSAWVVSYTSRRTEFDVQKFRLYVDTVDRHGRLSSREETMNVGAASLVSTRDGVQVVFEGPTDLDPLQISRLPISGNRPRPVTSIASAQYLPRARATSGDGTLVVWEEVADANRWIHVGLRDANGDWRERRLGVGYAYHATSNGNTFAVLVKSDDGHEHSVIAIDAQLRTVWTTTVAWQLTASMASNGKDYALIGEMNDGSIVAVLLNGGSGVAEAPVTITPWSREHHPTRPTIASDGEGFLAVWKAAPACLSLVCEDGPEVLEGARLHANLQRRDASAFVLGRSEGWISGALVEWDGSQHIAVWGDDDHLYVASIGASGPSSPVKISDAGGTVSRSMAKHGGGVVLSWSDSPSATRIAVLSGTEIVRTATYTGPTSPLLAHTPDGRAMILSARRQPGAPHHDQYRITASIEEPIPAIPSDAPSMTAHVDGAGVLLQWTAPPQRVNGYRVEYRIGDDDWYELEQWFRADELQTRFPVARAQLHELHAFRVRAWNDAGPSEYSQPAFAKLSRRRAVGVQRIIVVARTTRRIPPPTTSRRRGKSRCAAARGPDLPWSKSCGSSPSRLGARTPSA